MTPTDVVNFRISLAVAIAALANLSFETPPRALFVGNAVEGTAKDGTAIAADVYTVLRVYGGTDEGAHVGMHVPSISVQHDTRGVDESAVLQQAMKIHYALKNDDGTPNRYWQIDAKTFDASGNVTDDASSGGAKWEIRTILFSGMPGVRGRIDERWMATGSFDVEFFRVGT